MASLLASDNGFVLQSANDALDVISSGLSGCIFTAEELHPDFFDLQNGIAGGIFQKFVNYNFSVAFVLPVEHAYSARITELIRDHKSHPSVRFFMSIEDATEWLSHDWSRTGVEHR